jgi:hypothetical protein
MRRCGAQAAQPDAAAQPRRRALARGPGPGPRPGPSRGSPHLEQQLAAQLHRGLADAPVVVVDGRLHGGQQQRQGRLRARARGGRQWAAAGSGGCSGGQGPPHPAWAGLAPSPRPQAPAAPSPQPPAHLRILLDKGAARGQRRVAHALALVRQAVQDERQRLRRRWARRQWARPNAGRSGLGQHRHRHRWQASRAAGGAGPAQQRGAGAVQQRRAKQGLAWCRYGWKAAERVWGRKRKSVSEPSRT